MTNSLTRPPQGGTTPGRYTTKVGATLRMDRVSVLSSGPSSLGPRCWQGWSHFMVSSQTAWLRARPACGFPAHGLPDDRLESRCSRRPKLAAIRREKEREPGRGSSKELADE